MAFQKVKNPKCLSDRSDGLPEGEESQVITEDMDSGAAVHVCLIDRMAFQKVENPNKSHVNNSARRSPMLLPLVGVAPLVPRPSFRQGLQHFLVQGAVCVVHLESVCPSPD
jgi:hypothetical protein